MSIKLNSLTPGLSTNTKLGRLAWAGIMAGWLLLILTSPVAAQSTPLGDTGDAAVYVVQPGDTLGVIATTLGTSVDALVLVNGLDDPNVIAPGQRLIIPEAGFLPEPAPAPPVPAVIIQVHPGQSFASLASHYQVESSRLAAVNGLVESTRFFPGQPIRIPLDAHKAQTQPFGAISLVQSPLSIEQGRTGRLLVQTSRPIHVTVMWNGLPLSLLPVPPVLTETPTPAATAQSGQLLFAAVPAPALIETRSYDLAVGYVATNGHILTQTLAVDVVDGGYDFQAIVIPEEKADLLEPSLVEAESALVQGIWEQTPSGLIWIDRFARPIGADYPTSSPFGTRRSYNGGATFSSYHAGQDFSAPADVPVLAPAPAIVALAETLNVRGNAVILNHGGGIYTGYWHLNSLAVVPGQTVQPGDTLGGVGTTGLSTGNHLHWEMRIFGVAVDPMQFLDEPLIQVE